MILRASRHPWLAVGAIGAVFIWQAATRLRDGVVEPPVFDWLGVAVWAAGLLFGAAVVLVSVSQFLWPSKLELSDEGLRTRRHVREITLKWDEIARFGVTRTPGGIIGHELVGMDLRSPAPPGLVRSKIGGFDLALAFTYGMKAAELAGLLEEWRTRRSTQESHGLVRRSRRRGAVASIVIASVAGAVGLLYGLYMFVLSFFCLEYDRSGACIGEALKPVALVEILLAATAIAALKSRLVLALVIGAVAVVVAVGRFVTFV